MKNVLIVCGAGYVSGKEIVTLELALGLRNRHWGVQLVTSTWHNGDFRRRLEVSGLIYNVLPLGFVSATLSRACMLMTAEQMWRWPEALLKYRRLLNSVAPAKVIHTNWHHLLLLLPFLDCERDIFWVHETIPNKPRYRRIFRLIARRLRCFVTVSHSVAESLESVGILRNQIRTIHNGMSMFGSMRQLGTPSCKPWSGVRLGIIGQVGLWKGHEDLIQAFGMLTKSHPGVELHVFGQASVEAEGRLRTLEHQHDVANRVVHHGFVCDRAKIYEQIDVCVVPSRFAEPFGLVALEAGMCGLPVVASRVGGLPEIVKDGETGFLVESSNPRQLCEGLRKLLDDGKLRQRMGEAARRFTVTHFNVARFTKRFDSLLCDQSLQTRREPQLNGRNQASRPERA
jgi:glycosyltransferase involved in cell wall biosynthesis